MKNKVRAPFFTTNPYPEYCKKKTCAVYHQVEMYEERQKSTCTPKQCPALKHRPKFSPLKVQPDYLGGSNEVRLFVYCIVTREGILKKMKNM